MHAMRVERSWNVASWSSDWSCRVMPWLRPSASAQRDVG
jgi:hypothetical protein